MTLTVCSFNKHEWVCIRTVITGGLALFTLLLCTIQLTRLLLRTKQKFSDHLLILYIGTAQTTTCVVYYFVYFDPHVYLMVVYLKQLQYALICFFFLKVACRISRTGKLVKSVVLPSFGGSLLFLTAVMVVSEAGVYKRAFSCRDPVYIIQYGSGLCLSVFFTIVGGIITRKLSKKHLSSSYQFRQKLQLWTLILVNFFSGVIGFAFVLYLYLRVSRSKRNMKTNECFDVVGQTWYMALLYIFCQTADLLVPVWAALYIFIRIPKETKTPATIPTSTEDYLVPELHGDDPRFSFLQPLLLPGAGEPSDGGGGVSTVPSLRKSDSPLYSLSFGIAVPGGAASARFGHAGASSSLNTDPGRDKNMPTPSTPGIPGMGQMSQMSSFQSSLGKPPVRTKQPSDAVGGAESRTNFQPKGKRGSLDQDPREPPAAGFLQMGNTDTESSSFNFTAGYQ